MLTDLQLDNRRGWVGGWTKLCTCLIGQICHAIYSCLSFEHAVYITCTSVSQVEKISPKPLQGSDVGEKPKFAFELAAVSPLQLTLTKTSLQLFKTLVNVCNPNHNYSSLSSYSSRVDDNRSMCLPVNNV